MSMSISEVELYILSYYRACELAGAILFGKLALHTTIDAIRIPLTQHCLEEAEHAWRWTDTIRALGRTPIRVIQTYQSEYGKEFGLPHNTLEILCLTQVFELRTVDHFRRHLALPQASPPVRSALQQMIDDESGHLSWVRDELDRYAAVHGANAVDDVMGKLKAVDERVYARLMAREPFQSFFTPQP